MNEYETFPKIKKNFSAEKLSLLELFNVSYYAISPLRARHIYSKQVGSRHNYLGNALFKQQINSQPFYFEIKISTVESSLTVYSQEEEQLQAVIEKQINLIQERINSIEILQEEERRKVIHTISIRQQIDQILSKLLNKEPPKALYTLACNIREGFILIIDRLGSEDQELISNFQDLTLKYQTIINLIQKYNTSQNFNPEDTESIGINILQSKQRLNQFVGDILSSNK